MSVEAHEPDSWVADPEPGAGLPGPLEDLPKLSSRKVRIEERLTRLFPGGAIPAEFFGPDVTVGAVEILWRSSGLTRPGLVIQASWPRLTNRLGVGIDTPIAHAVVDRLLGYDRLDVEGRLQLTPVEWGIWSYLAARGLSRVRDVEGPLGRWDMVIERVGPDAFDVRGLGPILTLRWPVRVGKIAGLVRLWLPSTLAARWLASAPPVPTLDTFGRFQELTGAWRAEAGSLELSRGIGKLRPGSILPLESTRLRGSPRSPTGLIELALSAAQGDGRWIFPAQPLESSGGARVTLIGPLHHVPMPREALAMNPTVESPTHPNPAPVPSGDVPITLTVELGRINLALSRLADLRPGDVLELGRHSREPVELTSGGRLVARGELVQIDTELGVRVTSVFL